MIGDYTKLMKTFDPNTMNNHPFATFCPRRSVKFKVHTNRAHALNAIRHNLPNGILYKFEKGGWVEIYRVEDGNVSDCPHGGSNNDPWNGRTKWMGLKTGNPYLMDLCGMCAHA